MEDALLAADKSNYAGLKFYMVNTATHNFQKGDMVTVDPTEEVKIGDFVVVQSIDAVHIIKLTEEIKEIEHLGRVSWHYTPDQNLYPHCKYCGQAIRT
ncbi:MAG: S24 family peptidase [Nitrospirae bacterium]|nr:S24 family peptidase [Nitrospirota bacterium]